MPSLAHAISPIAALLLSAPPALCSFHIRAQCSVPSLVAPGGSDRTVKDGLTQSFSNVLLMTKNVVVIPHRFSHTAVIMFLHTKTFCSVLNSIRGTKSISHF